MRRGGVLLTIQGVTGWRGESLADALEGTPPEWMLPGHGWDVGESLSPRNAGFRIVEWIERATTTVYHDIGAIVFILQHMPWAIADFDVERYRERLFGLHQRIQREGGFRTRSFSYLIEAEKP